jgi:hypothetical protein
MGRTEVAVGMILGDHKIEFLSQPQDAMNVGD